jgi:hypothetical protein
MQRRLALLLALALAGCGAPDVPARRMESDAELQRQDKLAYESSPDIQLPELRKRLLALGVASDEIRAAKEENDVDIFVLHLADAKFARIDKRALAKLKLDSRYRFELAEASQTREFADYSVAEDAARRKQRYLRELAANGEMDKFPRYSRGANMTAYARALEQYCGYAPGDAFTVVDGRWLEYRRRMVDSAVERQRQGSTGAASFKCIIRIVYATDLQSQFVGNRDGAGVTAI